MKFVSVLFAGLMAVLSVPAHAASDDAIAKEIVFAYQTMCVNGIGKPEKFNATLKKLEDSKTILRLPDDQTKGLFKTKGGGHARLDKIFDGHVDDVLAEIQDTLWEESA